ncbi:MAG: F0F1 ATP synthase subunit beta, partial [Arcanobacterium sp.]|nr:F0F1 ATP synthase subunit beta [Arcanobacterium sp.]
NTYTAVKFTGVEGSTVPVAETVEAFRRLVDGEYDHIPEQAFYNIGGIDDIERAWHKIQQDMR